MPPWLCAVSCLPIRLLQCVTRCAIMPLCMLWPSRDPPSTDPQEAGEVLAATYDPALQSLYSSVGSLAEGLSPS